MAYKYIEELQVDLKILVQNIFKFRENDIQSPFTLVVLNHRAKDKIVNMNHHVKAKVVSKKHQVKAQNRK